MANAINNYIEELDREFKETSEKLAVISEILNKIELGVDDNDIQYGSKVLITWEDGRADEGRVWVVKGDGVFGIKRDGYAGTINLGINRPGLTSHSLKNLSVGTYGKLERERWILSERVIEIKRKIENAIEAGLNNI